jgi:hypothetical protein
MDEKLNENEVKNVRKMATVNTLESQNNENATKMDFIHLRQHSAHLNSTSNDLLKSMS